ncbi:hypothetical protein O59_002870 [Cellvibrio sp. BR]|nr:hypothetical protein O59_002870 [Cellvibrio sp. BR]
MEVAVKRNTTLFIKFFSAFLLGMSGLVLLFRNTWGGIFIQPLIDRDWGAIAIIIIALVAVAAGIKYCIDSGELIPKKTIKSPPK